MNFKPSQIVNIKLLVLTSIFLIIPIVFVLSRWQSMHFETISASHNIFEPPIKDDDLSEPWSQAEIASKSDVSILSKIKDYDGNLGNDILYYVMVDRFFDGDSKNNKPKINTQEPPQSHESIELEQTLSDFTYDPTKKYFGMYFGGDLQGVINKLEYLHKLGVTHLVLSPIQEAAPGFVVIDSDKVNTFLFTGESTIDPKDAKSKTISGYHGYWARDWFRIDPHFRPINHNPDDLSIFKELLDAAGELKMKVMLDISYHQASPYFLKNSSDAIVSNNFVTGSQVRRSGKLVAQLLPPKTADFYTKPCSIDWQRPNSKMVSLCYLAAGLPTLNPVNKDVRKYVFDNLSFWLEFNEESYPIAGFRIDAAKNLEIQYLTDIVSHIYSVRPDAQVFAEAFGYGSMGAESTNLLNQIGDVSIIDFDFSESIRKFFSGERDWLGQKSSLEVASNGDTYHQSGLMGLHGFANPAGILSDVAPPNFATMKSWIVYLAEHDVPRLRTERPTMNDAQYGSMIAFLMAARGVPMITWGGEIGLSVPPYVQNNGLSGIGGDPFNRQMMIFPEDKIYNYKLAELTEKMIKLRRDNPLFRFGNTTFLSPIGWNLLPNSIFMLRTSNKGQLLNHSQPAADSSFLYAFSPADGLFKLNLPSQLGLHLSICDALNGNIPCKNVLSSVPFSLSLKANQFKLFRIYH